ncbi:MAG: MAPEG family protein [Alphaproteobacteria bacterium]|nr:MAPEG family protein [Alphaproteobacteria bacterium]
MHSQILAPAAMLALWSMLVLVWFTVARFAAVSRLTKEQLRALAKAGTRGPDLERVLPDSANWKSHNYTHLMEQPTVFYAVVMILALAGGGNEINTALAWSYAGLRVFHSLWQSTVNTLPVRMLLFSVTSLCLIALAINAARATI